jgi:citrate synthase
MSDDDEISYPSSLGRSTRTTITLFDEQIQDLMGNVGFGELAFWLAARRRPTPEQVTLFEACLVALADHGFTPTAIATRMTYLSAPDSIQGALASGLLGGGSRFLGVTEDCGSYLAAAVDESGLGADSTDDDWDELARRLVTEARETKRFIPGLGHPNHKDGDPRTPRIYEIAEQTGTLGPHLALFAAIGRVHPEIMGRTLPLNGAGVCGAALADLGLPVDLLRGFALLARTAGLVGQIAEEKLHPMAMDAYLHIDRHSTYIDPATDPQ